MTQEVLWYHTFAVIPIRHRVAVSPLDSEARTSRVSVLSAPRRFHCGGNQRNLQAQSVRGESFQAAIVAFWGQFNLNVPTRPAALRWYQPLSGLLFSEIELRVETFWAKKKLASGGQVSPQPFMYIYLHLYTYILYLCNRGCANIQYFSMPTRKRNV